MNTCCNDGGKGGCGGNCSCGLTLGGGKGGCGCGFTFDGGKGGCGSC